MFGDTTAQPTCAQEKAILSDNIEALRKSYINTKTFAAVGIIAAGIVGYLLGKK